jgi:hypothetical protein
VHITTFLFRLFLNNILCGESWREMTRFSPSRALTESGWHQPLKLLWTVGFLSHQVDGRTLGLYNITDVILGLSKMETTPSKMATNLE